jgi:hypothetical protein
VWEGVIGGMVWVLCVVVLCCDVRVFMCVCALFGPTHPSTHPSTSTSTSTSTHPSKPHPPTHLNELLDPNQQGAVPRGGPQLELPDQRLLLQEHRLEDWGEGDVGVLGVWVCGCWWFLGG